MSMINADEGPRNPARGPDREADRAVTETGCPVRIPVHVQDGLAHVAFVESELSRATGSRRRGWMWPRTWASSQRWSSTCL